MDFFSDAIEQYLHENRDHVDQLPAVLKQASDILIGALLMGRKVLTCGNGGSALDAQHFASELINRFETSRMALPAIALVIDNAVMTSVANDLNFDQIFSRQIAALGNKGDVLMVFSSSGNSPNIINAIEQAHHKGMRVIACTGKNGGLVANILHRYDIEIRIAAKSTSRIQEIHLFIIHLLCQSIDLCFTTSFWEAQPKIQRCGEKLAHIAQRLRPLVFTNGVFDILHRGHIHLLEEARKLGNYLVVGINSDSSVRLLKKGTNRPVQSEDDRAAILAGLECVDFVTVFSEETPIRLIQQLMPDVLVKGSDYLPEHIAGAREVIAAGGQVKIIPFKHQRSTTQLLAASAVY
jgi:phosphoheptose isomerase